MEDLMNLIWTDEAEIEITTYGDGPPRFENATDCGSSSIGPGGGDAFLMITPRACS